MALRRTLGPVLATFYGVGMIVGAGIYSVIGAAAGEAGDGLWLGYLHGYRASSCGMSRSPASHCRSSCSERATAHGSSAHTIRAS